MHDGKDPGAGEIIALRGFVIGEQPRDRLIFAEAAGRLIVDEQVELACRKHVGEETPRADDLHVETAGKFRHRDILALGMIDVADTPMQIARPHAVLVLEHAARDERGRVGIFAHPGAPSAQILRPRDAAIGPYVDRGVAEDARGEDRDADIGAGAARGIGDVAAERQLGDVEIGAGEGAGEHLLMRRGDEFGRATQNGDAAVDDTPRTIVVATGDRQAQSHEASSPAKTAQTDRAVRRSESLRTKQRSVRRRAPTRAFADLRSPARATKKGRVVLCLRINA